MSGFTLPCSWYHLVGSRSLPAPLSPQLWCYRPVRHANLPRLVKPSGPYDLGMRPLVLVLRSCSGNAVLHAVIIRLTLMVTARYFVYLRSCSARGREPTLTELGCSARARLAVSQWAPIGGCEPTYACDERAENVTHAFSAGVLMCGHMIPPVGLASPCFSTLAIGASKAVFCSSRTVEQFSSIE